MTKSLISTMLRSISCLVPVLLDETTFSLVTKLKSVVRRKPLDTQKLFNKQQIEQIQTQVNSSMHARKAEEDANVCLTTVTGLSPFNHLLVTQNLKIGRTYPHLQKYLHETLPDQFGIGKTKIPARTLQMLRPSLLQQLRKYGGCLRAYGPSLQDSTSCLIFS